MKLKLLLAMAINVGCSLTIVTLHAGDNGVIDAANFSPTRPQTWLEETTKYTAYVSNLAIVLSAINTDNSEQLDTLIQQDCSNIKPVLMAPMPNPDCTFASREKKRGWPDSAKCFTVPSIKVHTTTSAIKPAQDWQSLAPCTYGITPLHYAIASHKEKVLKTMLDAIEPELRAGLLPALLMCAIECNNQAAINTIVSTGNLTRTSNTIRLLGALTAHAALCQHADIVTKFISMSGVNSEPRKEDRYSRFCEILVDELCLYESLTSIKKKMDQECYNLIKPFIEYAPNSGCTLL